MGGRMVVKAVWITYTLALGFVLLVPDGGVPSRLLALVADAGSTGGVLPDWLLSPARFEFAANVLIVVPAAGLAHYLWPARGWTTWTAYGFVLSLGVEVVQTVLPGRSAAFVDVVANTSGALAGAVLSTIVASWRGLGTNHR